MLSAASKIIVFLLFPVLIVAQKNTTSKLKNNDTVLINYLLNNAEKYMMLNADSCALFIGKLDEIKIYDNIHLIKLYNYKGVLLATKGKYNEALDYFLKGQKIAKEINNEKYIAYSDVHISSAYILLAYYTLAKKYLIPTLRYYEKNNNYDGIGGIYNNLTFISIEQKDFIEAEKYCGLALKNYTKCNGQIGLARVFINLAEILFFQKKYKKSIATGHKASRYTKLTNQAWLDANICQLIGDSYFELDNTDSAFYYYKKAIKANEPWGETYILARSKNSIAKLYAKQKNYKKAISEALEAFHVTETSKAVDDKIDISASLSAFYFKTKNYEKALKYKQIELQIKDSLFTEKKYKVQNEIEAIYESGKKEQKIKTLSKEKEIELLKNEQSKYYIVSLLGLMIILAFTGVLVFRSNKLNTKRKSIELEQRLLRTQMNPHFIFNAITSIQGYIMDKNPLEASSYLSNFAKLMRSILNNSTAEFISLEDELETLEHYLRLQKLRFPNKLAYEIIVDEDMETDVLAIPPMLLQPFIENAVNHGIAKKKEGVGKLTVEIHETKNSLFLKVKDNGIGINATQYAKDNKHKSMALQITKSRIANFKSKYKKHVYFEIKNIQNNESTTSGVQVIFELPKKYLS